MTAVSSTRGGTVYEEVRADVLAGRIPPGTKLRLVQLAERLGVSMALVREALSRLAAEGLVVAHPQRGFSVVTISRDDLLDLTRTRVDIETLAVRRAVTEGDLAWEANVVARQHALTRTPLVSPDGRVNQEWIDAHRDFHHALIAGCASRRLLDIAAGLRDAAELYRIWSQSVAHDTERNIAAEHEHLAALALARDPDALAAALAAHIQRTCDALLPYASE